MQVDSHIRYQRQDRRDQVGLHGVVANLPSRQAEVVEVARLVLVEVQRPGAHRPGAGGGRGLAGQPQRPVGSRVHRSIELSDQGLEHLVEVVLGDRRPLTEREGVGYRAGVPGHPDGTQREVVALQGARTAAQQGLGRLFGLLPL
jgi:hypothetical protein